MPRPTFINDEFYHIYNRGVEKRKIFLSEEDYYRFVHDLYEFNDEDVTINNFRIIKSKRSPKLRKLLVDIICWCLMPNHYHLLLRQLREGGISKFLQKLGTGYTNYFNWKYKRSGVLFQGKSKAVQIKTDTQLTHTSRYIHINSVELIEPNWKERGIKDWKKVKEFLNSYRWSSYPDYIGKDNFPSLIKKDFLLGYFNDSEREYKKFVEEWVVGDVEIIKELTLED
ncbi:MAG: hypothetical protein COX43_00625 [Parcubacteria group bacterium CG23_combo_of_CG06-09_8_20_14_all_35_9]|nr:MAG: hypothetical protein COX43_00625 [Parcubacteria group bacterium CG23_combo_of_CG06-09_8_20_14_all_35_9]